MLAYNLSGVTDTACGIVSNSTVNAGAALIAAIAGGKTASGITAAQAASQAACNVLAPAPPSPAPTSQAGTTLSSIIKKANSIANSLIKPVLPASVAPSSNTLTQSKYKVGSMARFNKTRGVWSVYSPLYGAGLFGVSSEGRCMGGVCLGDGEVTPAVPAGFVKAGEEVAPPAGVTQAGEEQDKKPFYLNPIVWAAAGGVVVLGTGGYFLLRKKSGGLNGARTRRRRRR